MTPSSLNNLTDAEKRVRIAEACGWRFEPSKEREKRGYLIAPNYKARVTIWKDWKFGGESALPDYLNDLNAMAEAEGSLNPDQQYHYGENLSKIVFDNDIRVEKEVGLRKSEDDSLFTPNGYGWFFIAHASARQRAEAFLATIAP